MFDLHNPSRKKTVKILAIGNYAVLFLDMIQGLGFVPLYLAYFGERMYGLWLGTGGVIGVLSFLDLGIATLCIQRVASSYGKKDYKGIGLYFFNGFLINMAFMIILMLGGIIANLYLDVLFEINSQEFELLSQAFLIALFALVFSILNNTVEGSLNSLQKATFSKIVQILGAIIGIAVTYIALVNEWGILSIPVGMISRYLTILLPNLIYLFILFSKNNIPLVTLDKRTIKDYLQLSPSVFLSKLGTSLVNNAEPTLINIFISPQVAVFYSITKKAGGLVRLILDRIGGIIYPSLTHLYSSDASVEFKLFIMRLLRAIYPLTLIGFLMFVLANELFVDLWVGDENYLGLYMTILIALSLLFGFFSNFSSYLISVTGDIHYPSIMLFVESMVKIALLYIFLNIIGVKGLPLSLFIASFLFLIIYLKRWQTHLKFNTTEKAQIVISILKPSIIYCAVVGIAMVVIDYLKVQSFVSLVLIYLTIFLFLCGLFVSNSPDLKSLLSKKTRTF